jgi:hypothetical protein
LDTGIANTHSTILYKLGYFPFSNILDHKLSLGILMISESNSENSLLKPEISSYNKLLSALM